MQEKTNTVTEKKDLPPTDKVSSAADGTPVTLVDRPIVVSLGATRRKRIKELKRGTGKLMLKVRDAVQMVAADLGGDAAGHSLLPVVVVYREKTSSKKKRRGGPEGMCPPCCI